MERITDAIIQAKVHRMQQDGIDIGLDGQYGRWRVTTKDGSRDLSPRASNREIMDWLWAFYAGWEAGKAYQFGKMRKETTDIDKTAFMGGD